MNHIKTAEKSRGKKNIPIMAVPSNSLPKTREDIKSHYSLVVNSKAEEQAKHV